MKKRWWVASFAAVLSFLFWTTCSSTSNPTNPPISGSSVEESSWERLFDGRSLKDWEVTDFGGQGRVWIRDADIVLDRGDTLTGITWKGDFPKSGYEVSLEASRLDGNDFFCGMTFPVGDSWCSLILGGWGGTVVGLSSLDGQDASENETTENMIFERGRWYRISVRVNGARIEAWIDGKKVIDQDIRGIRLSIRPEVSLSRPFGLAAWQTQAALRNIRLRRPGNPRPSAASQ
jgi:hypothetical protein